MQISDSEAPALATDPSAKKPSGLLPMRISFASLLLLPLKILINIFRHTTHDRDHTGPYTTTMLEK